MRIGILGAGNMADALGTQWVRAGHEVYVGARDEGRAAALAGRIGAAGHGSLRAAAEFGDGAVLHALPYAAGAEVAAGLADALHGRVLVDCGNPVGAGFALLTRGTEAAAEQLAAAAPGARVVKAFNLCHDSVWRLTPPEFDGRRLAVPVCGDDEDALRVVRELVRDIGCVPYAAGGLGRAALVEATAALFIGLWVGEGVDAQAVVPPVGQVAGEPG
ncbi:NADPH-dependent F420 reductase [Streptomyces flavofungini]|uniref:NAD(P)-binding domain-containing protein n=1 Tax=Streptomyces flavofungini TaxID=68200 RepID=A0ABS0X025_9ACTN|nr:NAD(P)-binding domain-containing protein [Streptomyces flavofungini]MBJ3806511.1 NAD(P)-binding domain-containing protein [Streptomyces flavofungini]GHC85351.1 NADP oxidoreductase [Streptomyces flavofungini]